MGKKIGFLSFGRYSPGQGAPVATPKDGIRVTLELAEEAERLGFDAAWVRTHHFEPALSAPLPILAAMASRTSRIDVGCGVIDLRYENALRLAEESATTDLICEGRLQLGISRCWDSMVDDGPAAFGAGTGSDPQAAYETARRFWQAIRGEPVTRSLWAAAQNLPDDLPVQPYAPGLTERVWWGVNTYEDAVWAARCGFSAMISTFLLADDGRPLHVQQADMILGFRQAAGEAGAPRSSALVSRAVIPLVSDADRAYFAGSDGDEESIGWVDNRVARVAPLSAAAPEEVVRRLRRDEAVQAADQVLFPLPTELGLEYNVALMQSLLAVAEELDWR